MARAWFTQAAEEQARASARERCFLTRDGLHQRGWTDEMIETHLGPPNVLGVWPGSAIEGKPKPT